MMFNEPAILHALLDHLADALVEYLAYQIQSGAQVVQVKTARFFYSHHIFPPPRSLSLLFSLRSEKTRRLPKEATK